MNFGAPVIVTVNHRQQNNFGDWETAGSDEVAGCGFAPGAGTEQVDNKDLVTDIGTLYAPAGSSFLATDRVVLPDGTEWDVTGSGNSWTSPFSGWAAGVVVSLKRTTG